MTNYRTLGNFGKAALIGAIIYTLMSCPGQRDIEYRHLSISNTYKIDNIEQPEKGRTGELSLSEYIKPRPSGGN